MDPKGTVEVLPPPVLPTPMGVTGVLPAGLLRPGAPVPVVTRLALGQSEVTASEAVDVGPCTAGCIDVVVFAFSSLSSIEVRLEAGSDRENWSTVLAALFTKSGFGRFRFRGIGTKFLRMHYRANGSPGGIGILTTTMNGTET